LARAEVALQSPEGTDDGGRNTEFFFFACKQSLMFLHLLRAILQAAAGQHLVGNLNEILRKEALAAIDVDDALIKNEIGGGRGDSGGRNAFRQRLLPELCKPSFEAARIAAIGLGECRSRGRHKG